MKRFRTRNGKNIVVLCLVGLIVSFTGIIATISGKSPYGFMGLAITTLIGAIVLMVTDKPIEAGSSTTKA